jgi:hypothetical protein
MLLTREMTLILWAAKTCICLLDNWNMIVTCHSGDRRVLHLDVIFTNLWAYLMSDADLQQFIGTLLSRLAEELGVCSTRFTNEMLVHNNNTFSATLCYTSDCGTSSTLLCICHSLLCPWKE